MTGAVKFLVGRQCPCRFKPSELASGPRSTFGATIEKGRLQHHRNRPLVLQAELIACYPSE
jgi:hypothetical protein